MTLVHHHCVATTMYCAGTLRHGNKECAAKMYGTWTSILSMIHATSCRDKGISDNVVRISDVCRLTIACPGTRLAESQSPKADSEAATGVRTK